MCFVEREDARTGDSTRSGDPAVSGSLAISGDPAGSGLEGAGGAFFATTAALGAFAAFAAFAGCPVDLLFFWEYVLARGAAGWLSSLGTSFLGDTGLLFSSGVALLSAGVDSLIFRDDEPGGERGTEKQTNKQTVNKPTAVKYSFCASLSRSPAAVRKIEPNQRLL